MGNAITLEDIIRFLLETPMFGDLDATELSEIVHIMQIQKLREGHFVFREGDPGDAWYVLYDGEVEVIKDAGFDNRVLAVLGPRSCFGEMAILDGSSRSASVRVTSEATAFRFPHLEFQSLLDDDNLAAYKLVHQMALVLANRQRNTTGRLVDLIEQRGAPLDKELEPILAPSTASE